MDSLESSDSEEDCVISLDELVNENEQIELEEMTMRGQASEEECTYDKGYMTRQGIFACKTCQEDGCLPAAICYGCSIQCHIEHDVYELWSKRNYRCDCGNERFYNLTCHLNTKKDNINVKNNYDNHNLRGLYCTCECIYDGSTNMISCEICEDWFHYEHIGLEQVDVNNDSLVICPACSDRFMTILIPYFPLYQQTNKQILSDLFGTDTLDLPDIDTSDNSCLLPIFTNHLLKNLKNNEDLLQRNLQQLFNGTRATIWKLNWRNFLCRCSKCIYSYESEGLSFLVDSNDTIEHYLSRAKTTEDDIQQILQKLDRPMQVEVVSMMHEFREQLQQFFRTCSESGKVVTERDVIEFFEKMKSELQNRPTLPDRCNHPHQ